MKKLIIIIALCLPAVLVAQEWEYVGLKKGWIHEMGFQDEIVYVNCWTNNSIGILVSRDKGDTFIREGVSSLVYDFLEFNNMMLAAGNWLYITKDTGQTWRHYSLYGGLATPDVYALAKIDSFVFAGHVSVQRETNPETNRFPDNRWPDQLDTSFYGWIKQMIVWNDTLFAAQSMKRIIFSPDRGETWDSCSARVNDVARTSLECFTINESYIFTGLNFDGIYRTSDLGYTWENVGKGIVNDTVNCMLSEGPNIIAGTQNGLFFSTDNGDSWYPRNYGLDSMKILSLEFHNDEIWMGCNDGLYKMKKEKMFTTVEKSTDIECISITPNPASDYIEINIPPLERGPGAVSVFDVLGVEVLSTSTSFLRKQESHGSFDEIPNQVGNDSKVIRIDISPLSPGVYFVSVGGRMYKFVKM